MIMLPKDPNPVTPVVPVAQALLTNKWSAPEKLDVSLPRFKVKNDLKLTAVSIDELSVMMYEWDMLTDSTPTSVTYPRVTSASMSCMRMYQDHGACSWEASIL
jgi:hypothetical protein